MKLQRGCCVGLVVLFSLGGCVNYVQVKDVASGREYLTTNQLIVQRGFSGSVQFKDLNTGNTVVLQSFEVRPLSNDEAAALLQSPPSR